MKTRQQQQEPSGQKPRAKTDHQRPPKMVVAAIAALKAKDGSSAKAISDYIGANFQVDLKKQGPAIRRALRFCLDAGVVVQGPGGFQLSAKTVGQAKARKPKAAAKTPTAAAKTPTAAARRSKVQAKSTTKKSKAPATKVTGTVKKATKKAAGAGRKAAVKKSPAAKTPGKKAARKQPTPSPPPRKGARKPTGKSQDQDKDNLVSQFVLCGQFLQLRKAVRINASPSSSSSSSAASSPAAMIHTKAREPTYPNSTTKRLWVPDDKVPWTTPWPEYGPVQYTAPHVKAGPVWADPIIGVKGAPILKFNTVDGKVNRKSYIGNYECIDGVPRNPMGRTGMVERGLLGKWGPNHAADPIVTRWKRDASGKKVLHPTSGKPILQFISIRRKDSGEWAIPGGMVDAGEKVSQTLKREFGEEAMNSLSLPSKECKNVEKAVANLFKHGIEVYRGYVDDPRNTDNSWMETMAVNFHDEQGTSVGKFSLHAGDDAAAVQWHDVGSDIKLYASHTSFIEIVVKRLGAHW